MKFETLSGWDVTAFHHSCWVSFWGRTLWDWDRNSIQGERNKFREPESRERGLWHCDNCRNCILVMSCASSYSSYFLYLFFHFLHFLYLLSTVSISLIYSSTYFRSTLSPTASISSSRHQFFFPSASSSPILFLLSKCLFIFTSTSMECCRTVSARWWHPTRHFVTLLRRTASVISKCGESVEWLQNLGVVANILKRNAMRTDRVLC